MCYWFGYLVRYRGSALQPESVYTKSPCKNGLFVHQHDITHVRNIPYEYRIVEKIHRKFLIKARFFAMCCAVFENQKPETINDGESHLSEG